MSPYEDTIPELTPSEAFVNSIEFESISFDHPFLHYVDSEVASRIGTERQTGNDGTWRDVYTVGQEVFRSFAGAVVAAEKRKGL